MKMSGSLTFAPALETIFLLLGCSSQLEYATFYFILYYILPCMIIVSARPFFFFSNERANGSECRVEKRWDRKEACREEKL